MTRELDLELSDPPVRVAAGEPVALQVVARRPGDRSGPVDLRQIGCRGGVTLDTDLFERNVELSPGEAYRCTVRATFPLPGEFSTGDLFIQAGDNLVWLPPRTVRVVPALAGEVEVNVERICGYESGTKVEVRLTHRGATRFNDFRVSVGPAGHVRAGVVERRRPTFEPNDELRFDVVVAGPVVDVILDAVAGGQAVGPVPLTLSVPEAGAESGVEPFRFLEPRRLTTDRIRLWTTHGSLKEVSSQGVGFPVAGEGTRYRVVIHPTHPQARRVTLQGVPAKVEVGRPRRLDDGGWEFEATVVAHPFFTTPVPVYYDVETPEGTLRGELHLSVRPTWKKHLLFAITLGVAITLKGVVSVGKAAVNPDSVWDDVPELIAQVRTTDLVYLFSIPAVFLIARMGDGVYRRVVSE
jgi:hypothetical protein